MNKNVENYKKAMDKVEAKEELKDETFHRVQTQNNGKKLRINLKQFIAACATFVIVVSAGAVIYNNTHIPIEDGDSENPLIAEAELPRFKDIDQLKKVLEDDSKGRYSGGLRSSAAVDMAVEEADAEVSVPKGTSSDSTSTNSTQSYSKTNVQVENVDEADIVKTDGKYIYYVNSNKVLIIDAEKLEKLAEISLDIDKNKVSYSNVSEIFVNGNKVIVLGYENIYEVQKEKEKDPTVRQYGDETNSVEIAPEPYYYKPTYQMTTARVYDISNKSNPKLERTVGIEGYYNTARMIDDNIYLIGNKSIYTSRYGYGIKNATDDAEDEEELDEELLPRVLDTASSETAVRRKVTDIAYIEDCYNYSYLMVAGFNINDKKAATFETVFGASDEVYASEKNLYVTDSIYDYGILVNDFKSKIFKFNLDNGKIKFVAQGEVPGTVHDQFSMDEYNGYLRIATTGENILGGDTNTLTILDEKLQKVGEIYGIAVGEEIKSVRFVGKVGYIVTFEQIDPLFVVDLSDPKNPKLRGELEIPGYSAYLHPYDETHIIGIGKNTETNKYGNTTTTNMKMSMFDVSDLDNPKEIFKVEIGDASANSEILYNHKALFYYKEKDLIGFPVTTYGSSYSNRETGFELYKIDLKNKEFKKYGELKKSGTYWNTVNRIIYIGENIFSLTSDDITKFNLETAEEKGSLTIRTQTSTPIYYDDIIYDDIMNVDE